VRSRLLVLAVVLIGLIVAVRLLPQQPGDESASLDTGPADDRRHVELPATVAARGFPTLRSPVGDDSTFSADDADCPKRPPPLIAKESEEDHETRAIALSKLLAHTRDADYLLAAALLSQRIAGDLPLELLAKAADVEPSNPLVAWNQLAMCRHRKDASCDIEKIAANAITIDGSNGALWMEIAMLRLAEDDSDAAVVAVRRAIAAPRLDTYFIDHALVLERAMASRSDMSYRDRVFQGMGYSAALVVSFYEITEHCRTVDESVGVWIELCDQLGAKMFADGRILLDQAIGRALQKIAAERSGDENWISNATADYERFKTYYRSLLAYRGTQALLENDEAVLRQYFENFSTFGELEAQVRLQTEAQRLRSDPDYDQCNFVSSWPTE
jgi:hypothetical protein